jgi:hypothetical protein
MAGMNNESGGAGHLLRLVVRIVVAVFVVGYTLLDELLFPLFRPLIRWLGHLRLFERIGVLIGQLPPYVVLVLLAVPFVLIEPAKVYALLLIATGHIVTGVGLMLVAQVLSLLILERIYHAGHAPLMRIGWFKAVMGWVIALRDKALGVIRATAAWRFAVRQARRVKAWSRLAWAWALGKKAR